MMCLLINHTYFSIIFFEYAYQTFISSCYKKDYGSFIQRP
jgi:hypothetical protein